MNRSVKYLASVSTDSRPIISRRILGCLVAAAAAAMVIVYIAFPNARPDFYWNWHDPANYVTMSHNLWYYGEYNASTFPSGQLSLLWPPGYPFMLLPAIAAFGRSLLALKLLMVAYSVATLIAVVALFRDRLGLLGASLLALYTSLNIHWFIASHQTMAEIPVSLTCMLGLISARSWINSESRKLRQLVLAISLGGFACYVKGFGICLLPAVMIAIVRKVRFWPDGVKMVLAYCVPTGLIGLSWFLYGLANPQSGYQGLGQLEMITRSVNADPTSPRITPMELAGKLYNGVKWFAIRWSSEAVAPTFEQFDPDFSLQPWRLLRIGTCLLLMLSWCLSVKRGNHIDDYFIPFFMILILCSANAGNPRYWVPVIPFFAAYIWVLVRTSIQSRAAKAILCAAAFSIAFVTFVADLTEFEASPYEDPQLADFVAVLKYVEENIPRQALIKTHHSQNAWLLTGNPQFGWKSDGKPLTELPDEIYVVVWQTSERFGKGDRQLIERAGSQDGYLVETLFEVGTHRLVKITRSAKTSIDSNPT
jgi:hypothetical protein